MRLSSVKRIEQVPKGCAAAALLQVLRYYGVDLDLDGLMSMLSCPPDEFSRQGISEGAIGLAAAELGFRVSFISYDVRRFDPTWASLTKEGLLGRLGRRLAFLESASSADKEGGYASYYLRTSTQHLIEMLRHPSVEFSFKPVSERLLCGFLDEGVPVLVIVDSPLFFGTRRRYRGVLDEFRGKDWGHVVTVAGHDDRRFWVVDPANKGQGEYWMDKDSLMNALIEYGPNVLVIRPEKQ